ncbi:MAG: SUMF1/EgtB/PvdO family nonheme iron enzyme [Bacteroidota bacterium]
MKHLILAFSLIINLCFYHAQNKPIGNNSIKSFGKNVTEITDFQFVPAGSFSIADKEGFKRIDNLKPFYISETEVTNEMYLGFLSDLKKQNRLSDFEKAKIDTNNWDKVDIIGKEQLVKEYHKWLDFPVVNISKEGAQLYCKWLLDKMTKEGKFSNIKEIRLPTSNEWMCAASGSISEAEFGISNIINQKSEYQAQIKAFGLPVGPRKIKSYPANDFGIYDMSGNVAEMINDIEATKGGSWNSDFKNLYISSQEEIAISPMVGFRVVIIF